MQSDMVVLLIMSSLFLSWIGLFTWAVQLTRISSTELQRTGSVRSSSAFSNQLLKAEAFLANNRNRSSTLNTNEDCQRKTKNDDDNNSFKTLASNLCYGLKSQNEKEKITFLYWSCACCSRSLRVLESSNSCSHLDTVTRHGFHLLKCDAFKLSGKTWLIRVDLSGHWLPNKDITPKLSRQWLF